MLNIATQKWNYKRSYGRIAGQLSSQSSKTTLQSKFVSIFTVEVANAKFYVCLPTNLPKCFYTKQNKNFIRHTTYFTACGHKHKDTPQIVYQLDVLPNGPI